MTLSLDSYNDTVLVPDMSWRSSGSDLVILFLNFSIVPFLYLCDPGDMVTEKERKVRDWKQGIR